MIAVLIISNAVILLLVVFFIVKHKVEVGRKFELLEEKIERLAGDVLLVKQEKGSEKDGIYRRVLKLAEEGHSIEEIAEIIGIPYEEVRLALKLRKHG